MYGSKPPKKTKNTVSLPKRGQRALKSTKSKGK